MFSIERVSGNIATIVSEELKLNQDKKDIIAYGTFAILQIIISILLVIIFGLIFHVTIEALLICCTVSILRKYSGGVHASSPNMCLLIGTVICISQALFISLLIVKLVSPTMLFLVGILTFSCTYYLIYKLAPVDSPLKPIKTQKKIYRMKKGSIIVLSVYVIITIVNFVLYFYLREERFAIYSLCIYVGAAWQSLTLTRPGHLIIKKIDVFIYQILSFKGRRDKSEK